MRADLALALVALAVAVTVASCLGACTTGARLYDRIHFLSPLTSVAGPVLGIGLAVQNGLSLTTLQIVFIVVVLAFCGPVIAAATGRLRAQNEGRVASDPRR
ncbi:MAG: Na+/H+ antiporter subunit [Acidimicrobiaceae bacterium]|nr:Na+/H+ antiporter subunit [Acidimicrobiaceae bacterium]